MHSRSRQIRVLVWRGIFAFLLTVFVGGIWTGLIAANLSTSPAVPWSVAVMAALLWLLWQYAGGRWPPRRTAELRRRSRRANSVSGPVFAGAVLAGMLGTVALAGLWIVVSELVHVPGNPLPDYGKYPFLTVALILVMASLVTAVAEEVGFRGYFQGALEGVVRVPLAIGIAALAIAPAHALTQGFVWTTFVFYLCVDVMLGAIAYLTDSIVPGIVVHSIGLLVFFTLIWPGDASRRSVTAGGADAWFWVHVVQTLACAALALVAFRWLAGITGGVRPVRPTDVAADTINAESGAQNVR